MRWYIVRCDRTVSLVTSTSITDSIIMDTGRHSRCVTQRSDSGWERLCPERLSDAAILVDEGLVSVSYDGRSCWLLLLLLLLLAKVFLSIE
jgi:hypothetical protein